MSTPHQTDVVGIDIGHSETKVVWREMRISFPSVAALAIKITDPSTAARAAQETVTLTSRRDYFFGDTARIQQGCGVSGLVDDWIGTPEYEALCLGAKKKLQLLGVDWTLVKRLVVGLPNRLLASQKERLHSLITTLYPGVSVSVKQQGMGPYLCHVLTKEGRLLSTAMSTLIGVIDIGHYTTDFMLYERGQSVEKANVQCVGMSAAVEDLIRQMGLQGVSLDSREAESALLTRTIMNYGQSVDITSHVQHALDHVIAQVIDAAERSMGSRARNLNSVLLAGGAAPVVWRHIHQKWPQAVVVDDPRFAIAEGFYRYGLSQIAHGG